MTVEGSTQGAVATPVLRRKAAGGRPVVVSGEMPASLRAVRRAVARAAQGDCGLALEVASAEQRDVSLAELLDMPEPLSLLAVLEGRGEALGLMALAPDLLAALIEQQTTGAVAPVAAPARRPTRTDAAMVAGVIDRSLAEIEAGLAGTPDLAWAGGYRYASFLDDPRPLGLLLEDTVHAVFRLTVSIGRTDRRGDLLLALPADARRRRGPACETAQPPGPGQGGDPAATWQGRMHNTVMASPATLDAVLCRMRLPLAEVLRWKRDGLLPLPAAAIDGVSLEGPGGRRLARARLGQSRGHRAVRLIPEGRPLALSGGGAPGDGAAGDAPRRLPAAADPPEHQPGLGTLPPDDFGPAT